MEKVLNQQKNKSHLPNISSKFKPDSEKSCSLQNHPLEGKYIIYKYGQQDSAGEGWALALFMLKEGKMVEVYHPMNGLFAEAYSIGEQNIEELMKIMEKKGIKEIYTVFHIKDFFGIPASWFSLHEKDPEPPEQIEYWAEYKSICKDECEHKILTERGIRLRFYDEPSKKEI